MGIELYITRADFVWDSEEEPITSMEWSYIVNSDSELSWNSINGEFYAVWSGQSEYEQPWLDWSDGRIYTKWPDTALYTKMLEIAKLLHAKVIDEEGTIYQTPNDWFFAP